MKFSSSIKAASSLAKKGVPGDVYRLRADASMIWTYLHIAAVSIFPASLASRAWRALETIGDAIESTRASATSMPRHRRVLTFLACNSLFMLVEFAVGAADDSIGLLSDAFHMLFDNASLVLALVAMRNPFGHANAEALAVSSVSFNACMGNCNDGMFYNYTGVRQRRIARVCVHWHRVGECDAVH